MTDLLLAMRSRRSVRHFTNEVLSPSEIELLLEDASWAPSGGDDQPWAVTAIAPGSFRALLDAHETRAWYALTPKIATMLERAAGRALSASEAMTPILEKVIVEGKIQGSPWGLFIHTAPAPHNQKRIEEFHTVMLERVPEPELPTIEELRRTNGEVLDGVISASAICFAYALLLAAHARGFAGCIQHSWLTFRETIEEEIKIPKGRQLQTVVVLGRPNTTSSVVQHAAKRAQRRPVIVQYVDSEK